VCGRGRRGVVYRVSDEVVVVGVGVLTLTLLAVADGLAVAPVIALTVGAVLLTVADVLHLAVTVGAPRPLAVTAVVVALAAILTTGRRTIALTAGRSAATTRRALAATGTVTTALATLATTLRALTTRAVAARVEAP
jgi:hypothetical protein